MPVKWLRGPEEKLEGAICIENLYELACLLRSAKIFVGNDSGNCSTWPPPSAHLLIAGSFQRNGTVRLVSARNRVDNFASGA